MKSAKAFNPRAVLEVTDVAETKEVLAALGITSPVVLIERRADESHCQALVAAMSAAIAHGPAHKTFFSGRAFAVQAVKQGLKQLGVVVPPGKTNAYWVFGKTGLD